MSTLSVAFSKIQASQLDGLAQSFRYKQAALHHLYNALIAAATKIKTSIQADWLLSSSEVDFEFSQSLSELRSLYESLELQKELNSIHQVEKGVQNAERTRPLSVVYIKPSKWSLFYSVISPLSSAIAAGCCTVVELPQTLTKTSAVLKEVLSKALNADTFALASSTPALDFTSQCMLVNQTDETFNPQDWLQVLSSDPNRWTVAVVDRTAEIDSAAQAIAEANFSFGGHSAYAPQIVLVNEFVAEQFLSGLVAYVAHNSYPTGNQRKETTTSDNLRSDHKSSKTISKSHSTVVLAGSYATVLEVSDRQKSVFETKLNKRTILVYRITSLDDALNLLRQQELAAIFIFAGLKQANYLSREIRSSICAINYVPIELSIGPIAPAHPCIAGTSSPRYVPSMFTLPAPQYLPLKNRLSSLTGSSGQQRIRKMTERIMSPLAPTGQGDGKRLNFFPQAILVGFGMTVLSVVGVGLGGFWLAFGRPRIL